MFDILPPSPPPAGGSPASPSRRSRKASQPSENLLKIDWKLPARLRKPVKVQLARERKQKQAGDILFQRRALNTRHLLQRPSTQETHTGDTYQGQGPGVRIAAPPYAGRFMRGQQVNTPVGKTSIVRRSKIRPKATPAPVAAKPRVLEPDMFAMGERDVPYNWQEAKPLVENPEVSSEDVATALGGGGSGVELPRRFSWPLTFSIIPKGWRRARQEAPPTPKKKVRSTSRGPVSRLIAANLLLLLIGSVAAGGVVANLRGLGRGWRSFDTIREQALQARQQLLGAQSALAEADFEQGEAAFSEAQATLQHSRKEFEEALSSSRTILRWVDVTGVVRSGESLLALGEEMTAAGKHVSRALDTLFASSQVTEESAVSLVDAIVTAREELAVAEGALANAEKNLEAISSPFLPAEIDAEVDRLRELVPKLHAWTGTFVEESDALLYALGADRQRQYLLVLANNHELRPTGGFMGSLALVNVDKGKVEEIDVRTVYDGDGQLKEFIAPPDPLLPIVSRWYLRDANWFVDFARNAQKIAGFFEKEGGPTVDGVILITPDVIKRMLEVTGPIEVPGYDGVISAENFITVTQGEVTYNYDKELNRPKQFLADLAPLLLNRMLAIEDANSAVAVLGMLQQAITTKEMLLSFHQPELQEKIARLNWSGSLPANQSGFLHVNNANIGGHKSDQFVEQEIDYRSVVAEDGDVDVTLTIRRTHNGPSEMLDFPYPPGENPAQKDNIVYQRVLVPAGAELFDAKGFSRATDVPQRADPSEVPLTVDPDIAAWQQGQVQDESGTIIGKESGYTFFANWMITKPGETTVGIYRYRLPRHADSLNPLQAAGQYSVYVAKQPGDTRTSVRVSLDLPDAWQVEHVEPAQGVTREAGNGIVYRAELTRDLMTGVVFE